MIFMVQEIHLFSRLDRKQLTSIKEVEPQEKSLGTFQHHDFHCLSIVEP